MKETGFTKHLQNLATCNVRVFIWIAGLLVGFFPHLVMSLDYQHADWQQGGLVIGHVDKGARLKFQGQPVLTDDKGLFVVGLGRYAPEEVVLEETSSAGDVVEHCFKVRQRNFDIQYIEGIAKNIMSPSQENQKRINDDAFRVQQARERGDKRDNFSQGFVWPLLGPITGVYGSQRYYNGVPKSPHYGVDIAAPTGTKVKAPAPGIVTLADPDLFYSGGTLILDHGHGLSSSFLHLSRLLVKVGDVVKTGDVIAEVGASGRVTGAHLDWRMNWFDQRIDPQLLVPPMQQMLTE